MIEPKRCRLCLLINALALLALAVFAPAWSAAEPLGPSSRNTSLVISEILFRPTNRMDLFNVEFIELYNAGAWPEDISGFRLSGEISFTFPSNSWLAAQSFLVVAASPLQLSAVYQITNMTGPWLGSLGDESGTVRLRNRAGALLLETSYASDLPWLKLADGRSHSIVLARPSLGEADPRAWAPSAAPGGSPGRAEPAPDPLRAVVINEVLANSAPPDMDFIEIYNRGDQELDISGCSLSDNPTLMKFVFQATALGPRSYLALDEVSLGFDLKNAGDTVYLRDPKGAILDLVSYGALPDGVSLGRVPAGGSDFATHSPATPFAPNTTFYSGDIVINEILYAPISGDSDDEFIELYNRSARPVDVSGWRFTSGISFTNPANTVMVPGGYLVIGRNATELRSHYPQLNSENLVGNYSGSLSDNGERITLARPELVVDGFVTNTIYLPVDEVTYGTGGRWGQWSHGGGSSLELIDPRSENQFAANWADSDETGKAPWTTIQFSGVVDLGVGPANELHALLLGEGECLLDSIEVQPVFGMNILNRGSFDAGATGWRFQGNHVRSTIESGAAGGGLGLHMRSGGPGDTGVNHVESDLTDAVISGGAVTIRAQARWLRGHPGVLLRLYGNGLEASGVLEVPRDPGTPGLRNSRALTNAGPAIFGVSHTPILPAAFQQVLVTAQIHDPDGVSQLRLRHRIDPETAMTAVPMHDDGMEGDAAANDGVFSAAIPGLPPGSLVAFHIEAVDAALLPATNRHPASAPERECLVRFGEAAQDGTLGNYRVWMTSSNLATWNARSELSDEPLDCTVVWNGARVIYNAGIRYDGDLARRPGYQSPTNGPNALTVTLPPDELLLGSRLLSLEGVNLAADPTGLRELTAFWMASRLGLPVIPPRPVRVHINGGSGATLYLDRHLPDEQFLANWFDATADGELFEAGKWIETGDGTDPGLVFTRDPTLENFTSGGGKKQARYRWNWRKRFNGQLDDNYENLFGLVDALNTPDSTYVNRVANALDPEWIPALAFRRVVGDPYGYGQQGANDAAYFSSTNKWWLLPDRFLYALGTSGGQVPTQEIFLNTDPAMGRLVSQPQFRRQYLQALQAAIAGPLQPANYASFLSAAHQALLTNGIAAAPESDIATWIESRRNFLASQIPVVPFLAPSVVLTGNVARLTGTAPISISYLLIEKLAPGALSQFAGELYPLKWTGVTTWSLDLPLEKPTQSLSVAAYDAERRLLTAWSLTVNFTGLPSASGAIVINEIMHHPSRPGAAFVELHNTASNAFDLSGWTLRELDMTFAQGTILSSGGYLVCVENSQAFSATYGADIPIAGEFQGELSLPAGTLTLRKPDGTIVDKVQYDTLAPWPTNANQPGNSLQLIDSRQDDSRVANWTAGMAGTGSPSWQYFTYTSSIMVTNGTNFVLLLSGAGDVYIDDAWLVAGAEAATGSNYLQNADFESGDLAPWTAVSSHTNSEISTNFSHSGTASLHVVADSPGGSSSFVRQFISGTITQLFTFSCWYRGGAVSNQLTARTTPGSTFIARIPVPAFTTSPTSPLATPGAPNLGLPSLPALPLLWLNEIQTENLTGPTDNQGEHEPWIELYNSGTNTVNLAGYALSDNYTQYSQWHFPPGATLGPGKYLVIWADGETNESTSTNLHTNFRLNTAGGSLALSQISGQGALVLDYLNYPPTPPDRTYGSSPNGQGLDRTQLNPPTPGASNIPPVNLFINEWMASNLSFPDPVDGDFDDWFEIYNAGLDPFDLANCYLTDVLNNPVQFRIPPGYVIPPRGFLLVWADNEPLQNSPLNPQLHVNFKLSQSGEAIGLFAPDGFNIIDSVTFGLQTNNISQGRFSDGASTTNFMRFPTPGGPNALTPPNRPPAIAPIPDVTIRLGQTVQLTAVGIDTDLPAQSLVFELVAAPNGASITPGGLFTWTPSPAQAPGTHPITVLVTDNGQPPLAGMLTFQVFLRMPPLAAINAFNNGHLAIRFDAITGRTYRVDWKEHLEDSTWNPLDMPAVATGTSMTLTDQVQPGSQRFYRIVQLD